MEKKPSSWKLAIIILCVFVSFQIAHRLPKAVNLYISHPFALLNCN